VSEMQLLAKKGQRRNNDASERLRMVEDWERFPRLGNEMQWVVAGLNGILLTPNGGLFILLKVVIHES
jgi:hypothetical protein